MADATAPPDEPGRPDEEPPEHLAGEEVHTALIERETLGPKAVQYSVVDGLALFEGDIILGRHEQLQQRTEELRAELAGRAAGIGAEAAPGDTVDPASAGSVESVVVIGQSLRWPGGVIPFEVTGNLPAAQSTAVTNAIQHWHDNTRLLLRARNATDQQWVRFQARRWLQLRGRAPDAHALQPRASGHQPRLRLSVRPGRPRDRARRRPVARAESRGPRFVRADPVAEHPVGDGPQLRPAHHRRRRCRAV